MVPCRGSWQVSCPVAGIAADRTTPAAPNAVVQGLWIGPELSVMEQLSVSSFLLNGHQYHLYVYDDTRNVPVGTVLMDADEILPSSRIFRYRGQPSYAGFANFFRYKLLLERGGWWVDSDVVCLKPFDFADDYAIATEVIDGQDQATNCVLKAPAGSQAMAYGWDVCQAKDPERLVWGETGPVPLREIVAKFALERYLLSHHIFSPVEYWKWRKVLTTNGASVLDERSHAIHLRNEIWRQGAHDKNAPNPKDCLYEQLQKRFLQVLCYG